MRKLIILILLITSLHGLSQVSYVVYGVNKYQAFGLSTDTKPSNPPNDCSFLETNTGKTFKATSGQWVLLNIGVDSIATRLQFKTDSLATALAAQTAATYATITTANGKQATLVSATNIKTINGTTLLGSGDLVVSGGGSPTFLNLASAFSSTSVTRVNVTGWSFAVTTGKTYRIEVIGDYQTAALTTGGSIGVLLSGGAAGTVRGNATGAISQAAVATGLSIPIRTLTGAGSFLTTTGVSVINSPHDISMAITFTCTGSGTFSIQWASEVAASAAQLNANSSLIYQALN